jgi:hypothetical protein
VLPSRAGVGFLISSILGRSRVEVIDRQIILGIAHFVVILLYQARGGISALFHLHLETRLNNVLHSVVFKLGKAAIYVWT